MPNYRRYFVPGGTYFFTLVTERRNPLFHDATARSLLGNAFRECRDRRPFTTLAMVLLPDHLHAIWILPPGDDDYSSRWRRIKREFTRHWIAIGGREQRRSASRIENRRRGVWQRKFWEHAIFDEGDLEAHFDYIHYNPVKHGLVERPADWPWSSFHRYVRFGHYPAQWGRTYSEAPLPGGAGE